MENHVAHILSNQAPKIIMLLIFCPILGHILLPAFRTSGNLRIDTEVERLSEEQVHRIFRSAGVPLAPRREMLLEMGPWAYTPED